MSQQDEPNATAATPLALSIAMERRNRKGQQQTERSIAAKVCSCGRTKMRTRPLCFACAPPGHQVKLCIKCKAAPRNKQDVWCEHCRQSYRKQYKNKHLP